MTTATTVLPAPLGQSLAQTVAVALVLCYAGRDVMPRSSDFLCYWTAGKLLAAGQSPYDPIAQARIQHDLGWDKDLSGGGRYDFLPFYCPPWLAMFCAPFGVFGYPASERVWFFLNLEFLLVSSLLLRTALKSIPRIVPPVVLFAFFPTLLALHAGQTTLLILLLITTSWCLLEAGRDQTAGLVLAGVTIKPQLAAVLVAGVLLWGLRRRRRGVLRGFAVGLGSLCLASTVFLPSWPVQLLRATRVTPLPTDLWPWVGVSWTLALRTFGLHGWVLGAAYAAAAVPLTALTLGAAWDPGRPLRDVLAQGTAAAFFVSPYAQLYDFPVLVIPLLVLLADLPPGRTGATLLATFLLFPGVQIFAMYYINVNYKNNNYFDKYTFMWIPCLLAVALLTSGRGGGGWFAEIISKIFSRSRHGNDRSRSVANP